MKVQKKIILSVILTILGFLILIFFSYKVFNLKTIENPITENQLPSIGQIGDFVGGYVGTLFSIVGIVLLFETLALQRKESSEAKAVFLKQQFDNTFFELLKLHKENVENFSTYDFFGEEQKGRKFFAYNKELLQNIFIPTKSISKNRKLAIDHFNNIYINFVDDFSIYFKTLYQLYSLIEKSDIKGVEQATYSKILRAQLSEGELFFIRYNAMTEIGKPSSHYINVFNILKHLSNFELLEFKDWWIKLDKFERNGLGAVIREIKGIVKEFLLEPEINQLQKNYMSNRYILKLESNHRSEFSIEINIDKTKLFTGLSIIQGLDKFTINEIENLLKCILKEFIIYSNYNMYNIRRELIFESNNDGIGQVNAKLYNWMSIPIKVHHWY